MQILHIHSSTTLELDLMEIEKLMEFSASNYDELNKLFIKKQQIAKELEEVIEAWVSL